MSMQGVGILNAMQQISRVNRGIEAQRVALWQQNAELHKILEENKRKLRQLSLEYGQNLDQYISLSKKLRHAGQKK